MYETYLINFNKQIQEDSLYAKLRKGLEINKDGNVVVRVQCNLQRNICNEAELVTDDSCGKNHQVTASEHEIENRKAECVDNSEELANTAVTLENENGEYKENENILSSSFLEYPSLKCADVATVIGDGLDFAADALSSPFSTDVTADTVLESHERCLSVHIDGVDNIPTTYPSIRTVKDSRDACSGSNSMSYTSVVGQTIEHEKEAVSSSRLQETSSSLNSTDFTAVLCEGLDTVEESASGWTLDCDTGQTHEECEPQTKRLKTDHTGVTSYRFVREITVV